MFAHPCTATGLKTEPAKGIGEIAGGKSRTRRINAATFGISFTAFLNPPQRRERVNSVISGQSVLCEPVASEKYALYEGQRGISRREQSGHSVRFPSSEGALWRALFESQFLRSKNGRVAQPPGDDGKRVAVLAAISHVVPPLRSAIPASPPARQPGSTAER